MLVRFIQDDGGQDLIEYALLSFFIGVCAALAWTNIPTKIAAAYGVWDSGIQDISDCTPDPISNGGGGC